MSDESSPAIHIAFAVDRAWCDDVSAVLAGTADADAVLHSWWEHREVLLDTASIPFGLEARAALHQGIESDPLLVELLATAPEVVRLAPHEQLRRLAARFGDLVQSGASEPRLAELREPCVRYFAELVPGAPRERESAPTIGTIPDATGAEVPDYHRFLDRMLVAAGTDSPSLGSPLFHTRREVAKFLANDGEVAPQEIWPGETTFAARPDLAFWKSPSIALRRSFQAPSGAFVVAASSGPVTFAVAGDVPSGALDPDLSALVHSLSAGRALVSFVWLETAASGPWQPI